MTSKQPRGSHEVLPCRFPLPCGQCPHPLSLSRSLPRAGLPLGFGLRDTRHHSCSAPANQLLWVHSHPSLVSMSLSLLSPSNCTRGTQQIPPQGSLWRLLWVSESSLGAACSAPPPHPVPSPLQAGGVPSLLEGSSLGAQRSHVTEAPPLSLPLPWDPQYVSTRLPFATPWGYCSVPLVPLLNFGMWGAPRLYPCTPSVSWHLPGDFTMLMPLNAIPICHDPRSP